MSDRTAAALLDLDVPPLCPFYCPSGCRVEAADILSDGYCRACHVTLASSQTYGRPPGVGYLYQFGEHVVRADDAATARQLLDWARATGHIR